MLAILATLLFQTQFAVADAPSAIATSAEPQELTCVSKVETQLIDPKGVKTNLTKRKFNVKINDVKELVFYTTDVSNPIAQLYPRGGFDDMILDKKSWRSESDGTTYWKLTKPGKFQPEIVSCKVR